jgi:hypothetical protein
VRPINIPYPVPSPLRRTGLWAIPRDSKYLIAKVSKPERRVVLAAAASCGMSMSEYVRFCTTHVAAAVLDEKEFNDLYGASKEEIR